jgi:hypothetical protein
MVRRSLHRRLGGLSLRTLQPIVAGREPDFRMGVRPPAGLFPVQGGLKFCSCG